MYGYGQLVIQCMLYKGAYTCEYECTHAFAHITCKVHPGAVQMLSDVTLILGIQDHSGLRLHLTPTLREYDIGLFEVAVNVDPNMILPPHFPALTFRGFGLPRCLQEVCSFVTFTHLSRFFKSKLYPEYNVLTRFSSHSRQHNTVLIFSQNTQFFCCYKNAISVHRVITIVLFSLSYERPILGNNLKAQSEMRRFS